MVSECVEGRVARVREREPGTGDGEREREAVVGREGEREGPQTLRQTSAAGNNAGRRSDDGWRSTGRG